MMRKTWKRIQCVVIVLGALASVAYAGPPVQLDISTGFNYDAIAGAEESKEAK